MSHPIPHESKYVAFYKRLPAVDADREIIKEWLKSWFDDREVELTAADALDNIWWDGQDLRHLREADIAAQLQQIDDLEFKFFSLSLAQDIKGAVKYEQKMKELELNKNTKFHVACFNILHFLLLVLGAWSLVKIIFFGVLSFGGLLG